MNVTAQDVKKLREATGAGMLDCKKALEQNDNDFEKAKTFLREKGLIKAQSKQSRIAAEGVVSFVQSGDFGYIYELNSETDFVAKNEEFQNLVATIGELLLKSNVKNTEEALLLADKKGSTIEIKIKELTAKIGEKITLRRVTRVEKTKTQTFNVYSHQNGKIVTLVILDGKNDTVGLDIAMQVTAMNSQYLSSEDVPAETVNKEKEFLISQVVSEGKPQNIAEKIVQGRIGKFFEEICLLDQVYVKDNSLKVKQYLANTKVNVVAFYRFAVGEGIEKKQEDFAKEVEAQINQAKK